MAVSLERAKEILGVLPMTISGRVNEIKSGQARNSGKTYYKVFVQSRADNREVTLYAWAFPVIENVQKGQSYDFDVDYSDRDQKYLAINRAMAVTYVNEEGDSRGYPASFDEPAISQKSIEPSLPPARPVFEPKFGKQDNDIHIIRESALKSAAVFYANRLDIKDEDDLIFLASKFEDYIKNGAVL